MMDDESAYKGWLAIGQNYELDRFVNTRVAFMAGRASALTVVPSLLKQVRVALQAAKAFIHNGRELGFIRMPDTDVPDPAHQTPKLIDAALASLPTGDAGEPVAQDFHETFGTTPADTATPTPKPIAGRWWLIAPDGSDFQGASPIDCIKAEIASRVPARVALARIAEGLNEPDGDECAHDECDDEGTCYECGKAHCR